MREPETMRLTLNAAETGHLVLATVHSSTCAEALQRVVAAFPAEVQSGVRAQLADCLVAVICQRLRFRQDLKIRVPECEILISTMAVRNFIRTGDFYKLISQMEMGAEHGMFTFTRYQIWLENKKTWYFAEPHEKPDNDLAESASTPALMPTPLAIHVMRSAPAVEHCPAPSAGTASDRPGGAIEIEPVEGGLEEVIRKLEREQ
jgi:twitching motility protein PilT